MGHRIHVIKVPTTKTNLFPYSHYADQGHDPTMEVTYNDYLYLTCRDLFKLKPNVQGYPKNRIDIYVPYSAAVSISDEISSFIGLGELAKRFTALPENFRRGNQTLPLIDDSRFITYSTARVEIAGYTILQRNQRVFIDQERPNEGHIEMKGPEIHFGIDLRRCVFEGGFDTSLIKKATVPESELRTSRERNPIDKAIGTVTIAFDKDNARSLATTLKHYAALE